jgi:hypothetical protein
MSLTFPGDGKYFRIYYRLTRSVKKKGSVVVAYSGESDTMFFDEQRSWFFEKRRPHRVRCFYDSEIIKIESNTSLD